MDLAIARGLGSTKLLAGGLTIGRGRGVTMTTALSSYNRRSLFLGFVGLTAGAFGGRGFLVGSATAAPAPVKAPAVSNLLLADAGQWASLIGTAFLLTSEKGSVVVVLAEVQPLGRPLVGRSSRRQGFAVVFDGPAGRTVSLGAPCTVSSARYGTFQLLLSGSSSTRTRSRFVAILG